MEGRLDTTEKIIKYMAGPIYDRWITNKESEWLNQGIALGRNEGIALRRNEGHSEGRSEERLKLNILYTNLVKDNRTDDFQRALEDEEYCDKLFMEYQHKIEL